MGVASDDSAPSLFSLPRNLSLWWSEESDGVLQRFERWAAYARGYNRLRSARLSAGRMTMHEEAHRNRWSINRSTNRLQADGPAWAPSFRHRSRQQAPQQQPPPAERSRLRCCAALGYQSNANLDSGCLEAYAMDHSIYFKTIGELRSEKGRSRGVGSSNDNNNGEGQLKSPVPIDCGDFLSSDFDEMDSDEEALRELDDADYELREQLDQLAAACEDSGSDSDDFSRLRLRLGEVQLCRSVINEDQVNNNVMMMMTTTTGLRKPHSAAPSAVEAQ